MYFGTKNYLKSNRNHTAKHALYMVKKKNFCYTYLPLPVEYTISPIFIAIFFNYGLIIIKIKLK